MLCSLLKMKENKKRGFTLIELIVVIAILAILAAILLPRFIGMTDSARQASVTTDAKNISTTIETMMASGTFTSTTTATQVMAQIGKPLGGFLTLTGSNDGDFTYIKLLNGTYYSIGFTYTTSSFSTITTDTAVPTGYAITGIS